MTSAIHSPTEASVVAASQCVITAWSAVSAFGIGRAATSSGIQGGPPPVAEPLGIGDWASIPVPDFDIKEQLGKKGTRSLDRLTGLTVTAVRELLDEAGGLSAIGDPDDIALVLGTDTGSIRSMMEFTRDGLVGDKPYHVDPSRFPNAVMNCAAGRSAIWYDLRGPNATISSGRVAGLSALRYGARLLRGGQANAVICGSAEELTPHRGWIERHIRGTEASSVRLGEGCVFFLLERADAVAARPTLARVLSTEFRVCPPEGEPVHELTECINAALGRIGRDAPSISNAVVSGDVGRVEVEALEALGFAGDKILDPAEELGDTGAASAGFAMAAGLAMACEGLTLITAYDRDGAIGVAVLSGHGGS